jgi:hypothetical protein
MSTNPLNGDFQPRDLPEYYRKLDSLDISDSIKDFDDAQTLEDFIVKARSAKSRNFIVDFSDDEAWCGFDLEAESYTKLLSSPRPPELNTRWINIWLPHEQRDMLAAIAKFFDFSPRLHGFMRAEQLKIPKSNHSSKTSSLTNLFHRARHTNSFPSSSHRSSAGSTSEKSGDIEERIGMSDYSLWSAELDFKKAFNPYVLANDIWHWSSTDVGRKCKRFCSSQ